MRRRYFTVLLIIGAILFSRPALSLESESAEPFRIPSASEEKIDALQIESILDAHRIRAMGFSISPSPGQILAIRSPGASVEIIGFVEVTTSKLRRDGIVEVEAKVLRLSRYNFVRVGDTLVSLDLTTESSVYNGHTDLLVRAWIGPDISSQYRPLFTQGFLIGETAQTLRRDEIFIGIFGSLSYGLTDSLTMGSVLTGVLLDSPNANMKYRVVDRDSDTVSVGLSVTKLKEATPTAVNLTLYWDSVTSDKMVSHAMASFALATFSSFEDVAAIKTAGSSSFQTGYEYVLDSWDRVLFGPNYNFELKSLGGYIAYKKIWNQFHFSASLTTVDVRALKVAPKTGYVPALEAYWRF